MTDTTVHRLLHRRALLRATVMGAAGTAGAALLAACGDTVAPTATAAATVAVTVATTAATTGATATVNSPTATPLTSSTGPVATSPAPAATTLATRGPTAAAPTNAAVAPAPSAMAAMTPLMPDKDSIYRARVSGGIDLYTKYPPAAKSVMGMVGRGSKVTATSISYGNPPVPPKNENQWWQEFEKRLGVSLDYTITPSGSYREKTTAQIAGGDWPDLMFLDLGNAPELFRTIAQGAFTDMTPYLSGDALKEFPNLAAYPPGIWKNVTIRGKILGVPRMTIAAGSTLMWRRDWAVKVGVPNPKNADEFQKCVVGMSKMDPDGNGQADSYGLGQLNPGNMRFFEYMFRVPNNWRRNPDGSLVNKIETDEFRAAVSYARGLWAAGAFHPDAATINQQQAKTLFPAGKIGGYADGYGAVNSGLRRDAKMVAPNADVTVLVPMGFDGGAATAHNGTGYIGITAIPATKGRDKERVKELLRILNYYAAPYGSEENTFMANGIEGVHFMVKDGTRIPIRPKNMEIGDLNNLTKCLPTLFAGAPESPGETPEQVLAQQVDIQAAVDGLLANGIDDPAANAFSPTNAMRLGELNQLQTDRIAAIVQGKEPLTALDQYIKDWRSRGGDMIRKEFEADLKS